MLKPRKHNIKPSEKPSLKPSFPNNKPYKNLMKGLNMNNSRPNGLDIMNEYFSDDGKLFKMIVNDYNLKTGDMDVIDSFKLDDLFKKASVIIAKYIRNNNGNKRNPISDLLVCSHCKYNSTCNMTDVTKNCIEKVLTDLMA